MPALKINEEDVLRLATREDVAELLAVFERSTRAALIEAGFDLSQPISRVDDPKDRSIFFYQ